MYCHLTSFFVCAHPFNQGVRDLILHIIADAPPLSLIRVQVSLPPLHSPSDSRFQNPHCVQKLVVLLAPQLTSASYIRHQEISHHHSPSTKPTADCSIFPS